MPKKLAAEDGTAGGKNNKSEDNDAAGTKRHQTNGSNNSNTNYNLDLARQRPRRSSAAEKQNFPPLALLLPSAAKLSTAADNKGRRLLKGQSFVNLPPLSRIEQNALLFHSANLSSHRRVRSTEKFANYMRSSPPADSSAPRGANFGEKAAPVPYKTADDDGESDDDNDGTSSRAVPPQRAGTLRVAPGRLRHPSAASSAHSPLVGRMSVPCPSRNSPKIIRTAAADEMPRRDRENSMRRSSNAADETGDGAGAVTVLLEASGDAKTETAAPDAFEATDARPLGGAASVCAASSSAPDKASLKSSLKVADKILRLNIGGSSYRIRTRSILKHGADTLLGRFVRMNEHHRRAWADAFFEEEDEYFFERVPRYFDPVYDFYASGKLHVPKDLCFEKFMAELRFWAVSKAKMDDCCSPFAQYCLIKKVHRFDTPEKDHFIGLRFANVRRRLWLILEGHSRSKWWKFFEITSTSFVVLSITALILASMPEFQVPDLSNQNAQGSPGTIYPTYAKATGHTISTTTVIKDGEEHRVEMVEHPVFNYVENICVIYFTLEYLLRFWVAPQKAQFVKEFLNVIDLLAICPFVFELILIFVGIRGDNVRKVRWAFLTVRLLRVLRVVRIAKLGRFSPGLANFALTLRKSKKQMQMVAIVLLTVIVFFSTLVYFLEKDEPNTTFTSIPAAFWWCLFSQTKWVPQTAAGKIVGGGAITCGVLVLALPIAILVNNFMQVVRLREEKVLKQYASIATAGCQQQQHNATGGGDRV